MNTHFHYYCIRVLAETAGFSPDDAEVIAYASQYVDDATENKPIRVANAPPEADDQHIAGLFDPVRTAHIGLGYNNKDIERKIYIAFHFLPGAAYGGGAYDYRVVPDGAFAQALLDEALQALKDAPAPGVDRTRALIKTGIALHTYADTWAHQRFSGRHNAGDNDIKNRERYEHGAWNDLNIFESGVLNFAPDVGHAEAGTMPDASYLRWRYTRASGGAPIDRDNTNEFTTAASTILEKLCGVTGKNGTPLPPAVHACLAQHADSHALWSAHFPGVFNGPYDHHAWRSAALANGTVRWDKFDSADEFLAQSYTYNGDPKWFIFHAEAGKQRDFVLRRIRWDLQ